MNAKKNALRSMISCVSLSLLTVSFGALATNQSDLSASSQTTSKVSRFNRSKFSSQRRMRALLGNNFKKFRMARSGRPIKDKYIVVYKDDSVQKMASIRAGGNLGAQSARVAADFRAQAITEMTNQMAAKHATMDERTLASFIKDPMVEFVEQDQIMRTVAVQSNATWGLDRVDEADLPLDSFYEYNFDGTGVDAYIIDTGILASHNNFGGRVRDGFTAINDGRGSNDCNGHGTHVAGTVGSSTYGVAKNVNLFAVRVLGCNGSGSNAGVIDGVNYVARVASGPSVANMSLGGGNSAALDRAVENAINRGITFVVAAGNSTADACSGSPNRVGPAITVGATTRTDARSGFSNFGQCVDIFAPGSQITSTWSTGNNATNTISGTSMASPHVAGVVALYLDQNPSATPAEVEVAVESAGVRGRLSGIRAGSPNLLVQSLLGGTPTPDPDPDPTPDPDPIPDEPAACAFEDDFTQSTGWTIDGSSTCSTGTYVRANPSQQTNGGVTTQVGGDAGGDGFAVFTARNTTAGNADVDGGECIAQSPTVAVDDDSTLSFAWFHGQRDSGDDPSGDFFRVEYSLNGGSSYRAAVSIGDTRTQAQWRNATAQIPAGSNVRIRIRTSDGAGAGDLVEGGIDTVRICPR